MTCLSHPDDATTVQGAGEELVAAGVLIVVGVGRMSEYPIAGRELAIGRSKDCDDVVEHEALSRRHAVIAPGAPPTIRDLGQQDADRRVPPPRRRHGAAVRGRELPAAVAHADRLVAANPEHAEYRRDTEALRAQAARCCGATAP